jgi:hypothetical protein
LPADREPTKTMPGVGDVGGVHGDLEARGHGDVARLGGGAGEEPGQIATPDDQQRRHAGGGEQDQEPGPAH